MRSLDPISLYEGLFAALGPQEWWPARTKFEVIVGAVLVQNTAWKNVERAITNLRKAKKLTPRALAAMPQDELSELIRPAGYYRMKARRLKNVVGFITEQYGGSLKRMFATPLPELREALLAIHGVGPETADSILLYAGDLPSFVIDAYTLRILRRHGWAGETDGYAELKQFFEDRLPADAALFNEYHAMFVRIGHLYCRREAKCEACPLRDTLPSLRPLRRNIRAP